MLHLASFSAFLKIPEVLRPAAAATRLGPGPTASSSDQGSQGVEIFEVACKKPLGLQPVSYTHLTLPTICSV